ncbi:MAG: PQQ-dependent sugar dehydrogenase [Vicinamibacterales bacterium]
MVRTLSSIVIVGFILSSGARISGDTVLRSALHDYRVVTVVAALVQPWSVAFLPGGDMLVTERPGRLRIVRNGALLPQPVDGVPEVVHSTQGGLLEVAPHPNFASNRMLYLSYSKPQGDGTQSTTALVRGRFENDRLTGVQQLFESISQGRGHFGGKIAFDKNGFLFLTLGDRQVPPEGDLEAHPAQDLSNHHGKMIRLHDDGRVPADNPFVNRAGALPEIWSYGHRNVQGLAIHPETGDVWTNEHGPQGGDELNRLQPGLNYGWPVIGFGVNYKTGLAIHKGTHREGMEPPTHTWVPSIGISGLIVYTGDRFPQWRGNLFAGGMARQQLARLTVQGQRVVSEETLVPQMGRIRDVQQGPDGFIYLVTDDRDAKPTPVYRLEPVDRTTAR